MIDCLWGPRREQLNGKIWRKADTQLSVMGLGSTHFRRTVLNS